MLNWILEKSLQNRTWVVGVFLSLTGLGAYQAIYLPIDAVPDITNIQVMINTKTGAIDPERIEKTVTYPIETEMSGLPGLEDIRSLSKYGLSQVILIFRDGTDLFFVRQQVAQRLQNLRDQLPQGLTPELAPVTTGLGEVLMYTVNAREGSELSTRPQYDRLLYLRTIQDHVVRPQLKRVMGVADIDSSGGYRKEVHINADTRRMEHFGVTFEDLQKKLRTLGDSFGGGYIQDQGQQIIVRTSSHLPDLKSLEMVPVKLNFRGQPVLLKDIAGIRADHTQRLGAATANGEQVVLGTALMYVGANSREVARDVELAIARLQLPRDVELKIVYTRSFLVNATIQTVAKSLSEGAALVVVVLLLLLGNLRAALVVACAIPISMFIAAIGMRYGNISASLMSLGAIDFGLLVDGSVVIVENILRRFEDRHAQDLSPSERLGMVRDATREVLRPVALGLFIIMIVYVPLLSLQGIEGKMFHPMAATVLMALGASLFVALLLMPVLAVLIIKPPQQKHGAHRSWLFDKLVCLYKPVLHWSLTRRVWVVSGTLGFAMTSFFLFSRLGSDFIPQLDEGDLVAGLVRDTSISLDESVEQQIKAERIIRKFGEVEYVFSRLGTPESATDPMGVNFADTFVILKKNRSQWPEVPQSDGLRRRTKSELMDAIALHIQSELPGHEISPTQPIAMRFNEILEGSRADVSLRIYGPHLDSLLNYIDQAQQIVHKIAGVSEVSMDSLTALRKSPVLNINLDYQAMARFGVSPEDANLTLMMAMGGTQIGNFYEIDRRFPIILHLAEELRDKREEIERIPVALSEGGSVPLSAIAKFSEATQVTTVARSFGTRYAALSIFLNGRDLGGFVEEAKKKIENGIVTDPEYRMEWGGQFKNLERARLHLLVIVPLILTLIFLILFRNFESLRLTLLVSSSIPLAITGGILSLFLCRVPFSISAAVGFIALLGLAILNSMVLVDFINQLRLQGRSVREAVEEGAFKRLRPVLMTALVAGLGFLPMALNQGLGSEVQRPLALVVMGGLVTSTLLTLVLLPTLYVWLEET